MPARNQVPPSEMLESLLFSGGSETSFFCRVESYLDNSEENGPQDCSKRLMDRLHYLTKKELDAQNYQHVTHLLHLVQVIAGFTDSDDGLPVLLENKLPDMIRRRAMLTVLAIPLAKFVCETRADFGLRLEAGRTLNVLLQGITSAIRHEYKASPGMKAVMKNLATLIQGAGDFELQITTLEALFRMTSRADRGSVAREWFPDPAVSSAMLHIRDSDFETDCRKFLNVLNKSLGTKRSVFSFPCKGAYLGTEKLQQPTDENLTDFWVDFNTSSHSISLFVVDKNNADQDEADGWETVVIKSPDVKFYILSESLGDIRLEMVLLRRACDISEVCLESIRDKTAIFVLKKSPDIPRALDLSLGKDKERQKPHVSMAGTPVRFSTYAAADSSMTGEEEIHSQSQSRKEPLKPRTAQQQIPAPRTKVSVPAQTVRVASHLTSPAQGPGSAAKTADKRKTESHCSVTSSTPRTPVGKNTGAVQKKKVKTPLQMVTSAQVSSSQRSGVKVSVPLTFIRLGSSQERRQQEESDKPKSNDDAGEVVPSSCPMEDDLAVPDSQMSQSQSHVIIHRLDPMRDDADSVEDVDSDQALYIKSRLRASDSPALSTVTERTESSRASTHSPPSAKQRPSISMEPISEEQNFPPKKDQVFGQQKDKTAKPPKKKAKVTREEVPSSQDFETVRRRPRRAAAQAALSQLQHLSQDAVIPDSQPIDPLPKPVKGRATATGGKKGKTSMPATTQGSPYDFVEREDMTLKRRTDEPSMETVIPDSQPSQPQGKYSGSRGQNGKEQWGTKKSEGSTSRNQGKQKTQSQQKQAPRVARSPFSPLSQESALDFKMKQRSSQQPSGRKTTKEKSDWNDFGSPRSMESMDSSIYDFKDDDQSSFQPSGKQPSKAKSQKNAPKGKAGQKPKPRVPGKKKGQGDSSCGAILKFFTSRNKKTSQVSSSQDEDNSTGDLHSTSDSDSRKQTSAKGQRRLGSGAKEGKTVTGSTRGESHMEISYMGENFGFDFDEEEPPKAAQKNKKDENKQSKHYSAPLSDSDAPMKKKPRNKATGKESSSRNIGPLTDSTNTSTKPKEVAMASSKDNGGKAERPKSKGRAKWKGVIETQEEDEESSDVELMREADPPSPMVTGFFPSPPEEDRNEKKKDKDDQKETTISFSKETFYGSTSHKKQKAASSASTSKRSKVPDPRKAQQEKEEMLAKVTKLAEKYTKRMQEKEEAQARQMSDNIHIEEYQSQPMEEMSPSLESESTRRPASHSAASTSPKESDAYGGEDRNVEDDDDDDESHRAVVSFQNLCKSLVQKSSTKASSLRKARQGPSIFDTTDEDDSRTERSWLLSKSKQKPKPQINHQYGKDKKKISKPKLHWDNHDTESTTSSWAPNKAREKPTQKERRKPKKAGKADKQPKKPVKHTSHKDPSATFGFMDESFPSLEIERTKPFTTDCSQAEEQEEVTAKKKRSRRVRSEKVYKDDSDSDIDTDNYDKLKFKASTPRSPVDKKRKSKPTAMASHLNSPSPGPDKETMEPWNKDERREVSKQKATSRRFLDAVHVEILKTPKQPTAHRNAAPHKKKGYKELKVNVNKTPKTPGSGKEMAKASRGLDLNSSFDPDRWVDSDVPGFLSDSQSDGQSGYLSESSEVPGFLSGNESSFLAEEDNEVVRNELSSILPSGNCLASSNVTEDNVPASPCLSVITHISSVKSHFTGSYKASDKMSISYEADEEDHADGKSTTIASIVSGKCPSTTVRPSASTLKRKYGSDSEDDDYPPVSLGLKDMGGGRITLNPKKATKKSLPAPTMSLNTSEASDADLNMTGDSMEDVSLTPPEEVGLGGVLSSFNAQIMKNIQHKKKQLDSFSRNTLKSTQKEVKFLWKGQMGRRMRVQEDFKGNLLHELDFLEKEMANLQACEEKALKFFENQQKLLSTARITHEQRFRKIMRMEEDFHKTLTQLDREQEQQQISLRESLCSKAQEMSNNFLKNIQQEEMKNMRKVLHNMFL
ncbi:SYCP2L [Branchiostoma lanceolatum]|uniref:SYCP2L protein n=1 Tax=Branchiostoma lanceolatum TaxID=7740 RepID=A0A8J9ZJQ2_BRALA|nr:SYCP2L [Branchiostoma lanceolatum]